MNTEQIIEEFNKVVNAYYARQYERNGNGRYFDQEFLTKEMFDGDAKLIKDIQSLIKVLSK